MGLFGGGSGDVRLNSSLIWGEFAVGCHLRGNNVLPGNSSSTVEISSWASSTMTCAGFHSGFHFMMMTEGFLDGVSGLGLGDKRSNHSVINVGVHHQEIQRQ